MFCVRCGQTIKLFVWQANYKCLTNNFWSFCQGLTNNFQLSILILYIKYQTKINIEITFFYATQKKFNEVQMRQNAAHVSQLYWEHFSRVMMDTGKFIAVKNTTFISWALSKWASYRSVWNKSTNWNKMLRNIILMRNTSFQIVNDHHNPSPYGPASVSLYLAVKC